MPCSGLSTLSTHIGTEKWGENSESNQSIFDNLDSHFYLAGGTALSLQVGHRKSIDLDYFINTMFILKNT